MSLLTFNLLYRDAPYVGAVYPSGAVVLCAVDKPEDTPWNLSTFQSLDLMRQITGAEPVFDAAKSATTTPKPAPQPCPLPDGDCTTPPDVVTGG